MRLKEINDTIAAACNVRASVVTAVQNETFRQIRAALSRGEKVLLPEFGSFVVKEGPAAEPGGEVKRIVRFREQRPEADAKAEKRRDKKGGDKKGGDKKEGGGRKARAEAAEHDDED
jgi:nucleoid DNA-binding protein